MTAPHIVDPAGLLGQALADASPDLMRELLQTMINALLSADADAVCGAEWNARSAERTNRRNGYRHRPLDTRVGTVDVAIPKLRSGSYFPEWLLERRKRAESALITVVADCYLAGVSTRRMDKLVKTLGIASLSKSQVSRMAEDLDEQVAAFRHRRLDEAGPFTFVTADALTIKVRENKQVVKAVVLLATGVNGDGHREVLGMQVATSETKASWNTFFADLVARGLGGVRLVTSDAHAGLIEAIAANLPGAVWQRCRTHYAANLMAVCPKSMWPAVKAMLHSVYDQPTATAVHEQFTGSSNTPTAGCPRSPTTSATPARTCSPSPGSPTTCGARSGLTTPPNGSTARSAAAPTLWASSPTATPSSASSAPSWPNRPTNGPKAAATSDAKSSAAADLP
ncbi:Transposase (or an inactivated derivative) [Gordonia westfalica]|uniref:Mutator family transposase n=1 Tax=Gordonia westfalica TaxID=158898 RepID=A0A1H2LEI3_9ACTN|nr:Transposase (or an inactivated derivative) [Gordonia westfalica]